MFSLERFHSTKATLSTRAFEVFNGELEVMEENNCEPNMFIPVAPDEVILLRCRDIRLTTVSIVYHLGFFLLQEGSGICPVGNNHFL
jgi:hypothetical protein